MTLGPGGLFGVRNLETYIAATIKLMTQGSRVQSFRPQQPFVHLAIEAGVLEGDEAG